VQRVDLTCKSPPRWICRVCVGAGALEALFDDLARELSGRRLIVVADANVAKLHAEAWCLRLHERGFAAELLSFPAGEEHKVRQTKQALEDRLFDLGADRHSVFVGFGGGVTNDLTGFLAATWHRGSTLIQIPTTLLAMTDASVGGKSGVNLPGGKNLVGAFHQPWGVYADTDLLATLDDSTYRDGFAEVIKAGMIADGGFFRWLESSVDSLLARSPAALEQAVTTAIAIKSRIVASDERETGRRAVLNFGHTVAHAIETASDYALSHGQAVSVGMCAEARLAQQDTGLGRGDSARLAALLGRFGLPTTLPDTVDLERVVVASQYDKKNRAGQLRYAPPRRVGAMLPGQAVTVELDRAALRLALQAADDV